MSDNRLSIQTVIVLPRNKHYCSYILNDGSKHSKKYEEMKSFLIDLVPSKSREIRDLVSRFRYFIVYVQDQTMEEFEFDFEAERKKMLNNQFQKQISDPEVALKSQKMKTVKSFFERSDDFFRKQGK